MNPGEKTLSEEAYKEMVDKYREVLSKQSIHDWHYIVSEYHREAYLEAWSEYVPLFHLPWQSCSTNI